uniref:Thaumatin-like protein n=2 Tax=Oryza sativa subsp. japonica TaxID=39947 RepID=Q8S7S5_ORYSJ|nr:hypothetical protein [Oryza sativa Japonica Group]AAP54708.1 hypothetical protein LOC_Os10g38100 [Oryza sativa Japonica Group]
MAAGGGEAHALGDATAAEEEEVRRQPGGGGGHIVLAELGALVIGVVALARGCAGGGGEGGEAMYSSRRSGGVDGRARWRSGGVGGRARLRRGGVSGRERRRRRASAAADGDASALSSSTAPGECGGRLDCGGTGATPPATLFEVTLGKGGGGGGAGDLDYYDVSLVDGYSLPIVAVPQAGGGCATTGCTADLNRCT